MTFKTANSNEILSYYVEIWPCTYRQVTAKLEKNSAFVPILFEMFVLNIHCKCCAMNFEIKMFFNQTITMFLSEDVTSLPKDKC